MNKTSLFILVAVLLLAGGLVWVKSQQGGGVLPATSGQSSVSVPIGETPVKPESVKSEKGENSISLTVTSPANGSKVNTPQVAVRGRTVPGAEVFVNETQVVADKNGNFSVTVTLDEGENIIVVTASDADGNATDQEITVTYDSGQ